MARLRDPDIGCPWDVEQDFSSIAPYTIEEAYEVADAIERNDLDELRDELGDLLLQVVFHAQMAEEQGVFAFRDVVATITDKMIRRHPHVFGDERRGNEAGQLARWEEIKAAERAGRDDGAAPSELDGIARALPALMRAQKLGKRAARVGFDWPDVAGSRAKVDEELAELDAELARPGGARPERLHEELGDVLFSAVNLCRHTGVDAEEALRDANGRFERRFRLMEAERREAGGGLAGLDADALEAAWQRAKAKA
jgi:MazG family protein